MTLGELLGREPQVIAEIGVFKGKGAQWFRQQFPNCIMYLIDPWGVNTIPRSYGIDNTPEKWARVEAICRARFANDPRVLFMKTTAADALAHFPDHSIDVLRLDAGREYALLQLYFQMWIPKVAAGGVFCGRGLAGKMRGDVRLALTDRFGSRWVQTGITGWAVKL